MHVAEMHLAIIIRTTKAGPATTLALVWEVSMGAATGTGGPGERFRHFWTIASLLKG